LVLPYISETLTFTDAEGARFNLETGEAAYAMGNILFMLKKV